MIIVYRYIDKNQKSLCFHLTLAPFLRKNIYSTSKFFLRISLQKTPPFFTVQSFICFLIHMKYIAILLTLLFLSIYMIVYAVNDTPLVQFENIVMCENIPLTLSWSDIRITEVSFDGSDERIEITNIWDQDFSWTITLSWVRSTPISYQIQLPSTLSLIFWDSLSSLTGDISTTTGQWFSISDSTWLVLSLLVDWQITHQYAFSKNIITQIPNTFWLEAVRSGSDLLWMQTSVTTNYNTISPLVANPWVLFCSPEIEIIIDEPTPEYTWWDIEYITGDIYSWADSSELSWDQELPDNETPPEEPIEPEIISPDTGYSITPFTPQQLPCVISEIHPTTDTYPEYVELLCPTPFSGTIKTMGIGVWETNKDILINTHGWYWIIASTLTGFLSSFNTSIITSISLRDAWETITLSLSGFTTWSTTFPDIPSWKSFYPLCGITGCIWLSSPWFSEFYISWFVLWPISYPVPPATTQSTSTSTYYQDLYNKRKNTAEWYKSENTALKKEQTRITKELTTLQKKVQTPATAKKPESKTTIKASAIKVTTPKTTTKAATTTTKKTPTVSTTSKAYIQCRRNYSNNLRGSYKFIKIS